MTRQSLYAATLASLREYAVLRALGIPRWRMMANVAWLSFWIGLAGLLLSFPIIVVLVQLASLLNVPIQLPWWLLTVAITVTWALAIVSGLSTLRAVRLIEPLSLLR